MSTQGHESEAINVSGLKASLKKGGNIGIYNEAICSTAGGTAAKVTNTTPPSFTLTAGAKILVKFTYAISAENATLQVGSTTAKPIYYKGSALPADLVKAGTSLLLSYDGTSYNIVGDLNTESQYTLPTASDQTLGGVKVGTNLSIDQDGVLSATDTTYSAGSGIDITNGEISVDNTVVLKTDLAPAKLGSGIGTCSTSSGTALEVTLSDYNLVQNGIVAVTFTNDVPAGATLNINGKGAKPIYYKGSVITADTIKADDTVMFSYDGTNYVVTSLGGGGGSSDWQGTIIVNLEAYEEEIKISQDFGGVEVTLTNITDSEVVEVKTLASGETSVTFSGLTPLKDYTVSVSDAEGCVTPSDQTVLNISIGATVIKTFAYDKIVWKTGYIVLDQTSSDPTTKVLDMEGHGYSNYQRPEVITAIRNASHRYVGTFANNVMSLKQLDDTDGTKYADGTSAATDIATQGKDVFMKLPVFFTKVYTVATDKIKIEFAYCNKQEQSPDGTGWKQWGGNDLIAVYEASASDSGDNANGGLYSRSGVASNSSISQSNFKSKAHNRGTGFSLVKWRHHCIMAILFYAYYGHTNSWQICGTGGAGYTNNTGLKNTLGMTDSTPSNGNSNNTNFWGLEAWGNNKSEAIDNVITNSSSGTWTITEDDGNTRNAYSIVTSASITVYPSKLVLGDNLDTMSAPGQSGGSNTTGYCDENTIQRFSNAIVLRHSKGFNSIYLYATPTTGHVTIGSRLAFKGTIEIVD